MKKIKLTKTILRGKKREKIIKIKEKKPCGEIL
jgi:hypothetical protein